MPVIQVETLGAGGGSIGRIDEIGRLRVVCLVIIVCGEIHHAALCYLSPRRGAQETAKFSG